MLYVFGVGEVPISISGDPMQPQTLVHTTRAVGAVTRAISALKRGDVLGRARPVWQRLAGGGGSRATTWCWWPAASGWRRCARCMYYLLAHREQYGKVVLLYGTRTPAGPSLSAPVGTVACPL